MKRINCPDCAERGYSSQMSSVGCAHCAFENTMRGFSLTDYYYSDKTLSDVLKREHCFHDKRKWRFDFVCTWRFYSDVAVELDGGIWINGGHSGGQDQIDDMEKLNHAAILGWKVFHFTPEQCVNGYAALWMAQNVFGIEVN